MVSCGFLPFYPLTYESLVLMVIIPLLDTLFELVYELKVLIPTPLLLTL